MKQALTTHEVDTLYTAILDLLHRPEVATCIRRRGWTSLKKYLEQTGFQMQCSVTLLPKGMEKLRVLLWKLGGGDVMHTSYSAMFHDLERDWDVNQCRLAVVQKGLHQRSPAIVSKEVADELVDAVLALLDSESLLATLGGTNSNTRFKDTFYKLANLTRVPATVSPLRKMLLMAWVAVGRDTSEFPMEVKHLKELGFDYDTLGMEVRAKWEKKVKENLLKGVKMPGFDYQIDGDSIIVNHAKVVIDAHGNHTVKGPTKFVTKEGYTPIKDPHKIDMPGYKRVTIHRGSDDRITRMDYAEAELKIAAMGSEPIKWPETNFSDNPWQILSGTGRTPQKYTSPFHELPKENTMKAYQTVNYVYGNDITTLSTEQLIAAIKKAEGERNALDGVKAPSKKIKGMQAELDEAIAKMVEALDSKN